MAKGFGRSIRGHLLVLEVTGDSNVPQELSSFAGGADADIGVAEEGLVLSFSEWSQIIDFNDISLKPEISESTDVDTDQWLSIDCRTTALKANVRPENPSALLSRLERYGPPAMKAQTTKVWKKFEKKKSRSPLVNTLILLALVFVGYLLWGGIAVVEHIIVDRYIPLSAGQVLAEAYLPQFTADRAKAPDTVHNAVEAIGQRLAENLPKQLKGTFQNELTFHVVKDKSINAFALPGGHIIVFTGLIKACENEDQLAAIIAHELSHVMNRDGLKAVVSQIKWQILMSLVAGDLASDQQVLLEQVKTLSTLRYSRSVEERADVDSIMLMHKSGYDVHQAPAFFRIMEQNDKYGKYMITFMSDHPATVDRIELLEDLAADLQTPEKEPKTSVTDWNEVKNSL
jgi:Zn-dependent protease with chaperone function